jgi:Pentapeptide repeats (8 copies)/Short C-terminal domain
MLRTGGLRLLLLAVLALLASAPAAAACAPDSGPNLSNRVVTSGDLATHPSLECANFQHADLRGLSFVQADLKTADFRYANVTGDDFTQAELYDSNFYGARAARAHFGQATMQYANLQHANLQGADFTQTSLQHAGLGGSNTSGADFTQADTYRTTGLPSGSGLGGVALIIFIAIGLLVAVAILSTIRKMSSRSGRPIRTTQARSAPPKSNRPRSVPAAPSPRDSGSADGDDVTQLAQLTALHERGELTDEEFSAAKQRIIAQADPGA